MDVKEALQRCITINQVNGIGIAQNNGISAAINCINDWVDEKVSSSSTPLREINVQSREKFLKEFSDELLKKVDEIVKQYPSADRSTLNNVISDSLYWLSKKADGSIFALEQYVVLLIAR